MDFEKLYQASYGLLTDTNLAVILLPNGAKPIQGNSIYQLSVSFHHHCIKLSQMNKINKKEEFNKLARMYMRLSLEIRALYESKLLDTRHYQRLSRRLNKILEAYNQLARLKDWETINEQTPPSVSEL